MNEDLTITLLVIIGIIVGLVGLAALIAGAVNLFSYAGKQGFVGLAAYVACWVFMAPIMATICILVGLFVLFVIIRERWF